MRSSSLILMWASRWTGFLVVLVLTIVKIRQAGTVFFWFVFIYLVVWLMEQLNYYLCPSLVLLMALLLISFLSASREGISALEFDKKVTAGLLIFWTWSEALLFLFSPSSLLCSSLSWNYLAAMIFCFISWSFFVLPVDAF